MSNITAYPLQDWFETTLAQSWNGAIGTVYLNTAPSFTFPSGVKTYIVVNPWKTNMQVGEIDSLHVWNKTVNVSSISVGSWAGTTYTQESHSVWSTVIISDNYQFWKNIIDAVNSKMDLSGGTFTGDVSFSWTGTEFRLPNLTTAERLALTPWNGTIVYDSTIWENYQYISWVWSAVSAGSTQPNASETVAGKVEEATQTQLNNGDATGETGARLFTNPSKLPTAVASYVTNNAGVNAAVKAEALEVIDDEWVESIVDRDTYLLWEPAAAGDSLFVEDMVTFASATQVQAIGDVTANTRVAILAFGSWVASNTLKLSLRKYVSPWVNLSVEIETYTAWEPSGTLFDPDATATVLASELSTIQLRDFKTTTFWVSDSWFLPFPLTAWWFTSSNWLRFQANNNIVITSVEKNGICTATTAYIKTDAWVILQQATFSGNVATFSQAVKIPNATFFKIEADSWWASYTNIYLDPWSNVSWTNVSTVWWSLNWANSWRIWNIIWVISDVYWWDFELADTITIPKWQPVFIVLKAVWDVVNGTNYFGVGYRAIDTTTRRAKTFNGTVWSAGQATRFYYTTSTLFNSKLLSLTDATYSYKLPTDVPRIATESKGTGQNVIATTLWFNDNFSGLTPLADYYLSNTPWAISTTNWTNNYRIWDAINDTTLNVNPYWPNFISSASVAASVSIPTGTNVILIKASATDTLRFLISDLILTKYWKNTATMQAAQTNGSNNTPTFTATWSWSTLSITGTNITTTPWTVYFYRSL